jgi:hypothetical protein
MARKLLVLARDDDLHADAVLDHCYQRGIEIVRFDVRELIGGSVSLRIELRAGKRRALITADGHVISLADDLAVFCREFDLPSVSSSENINECVALEEARAVLSGWASSIARDRWVDHPVVQAEFDNKPLQLEIAQRYGLVIPDTLITNDPDAAKSFGSNRSMVIKQLSNLSYIGINQRQE